MGNLTATKLKALTQPGKYSDGEGLELHVSGKGARSWILRAQRNGKRREFGLGSAREIGLAEARERAAEFRAALRRGEDPSASRQSAPIETPTFRAVAKMVHGEHTGAWKNGKHRDQWLSSLELHVFPHIGDLPVDEIAADQIRDALALIWLAIPETARRVRQRIGATLDYAHAKGWRAAEAPLRSVTRGLPRQPKKDNHFAAAEYADAPAFIVRLRERVSHGRLALEALIHTAARSGEIRGATWDEIDFESAVWTIPADRMKAGKTHVVPLCPAALDVFRRAQLIKLSGTNYVFPGIKRGQPLSDMTLTKVMRDHDRDETVHGWRSTFRDWVSEETEFSGDLAEAALAHTIANKVEAAYRRGDLLAKRRKLMTAWSAYLTGDTASVVRLAS